MKSALVLIAVGLACLPTGVQAQTCSASTAPSFEETFDDTTYRDASETAVNGWGNGAIELQRKGNAFQSQADSFGVRVFTMTEGDFDEDGRTDMIAQLLSPDCHLHFMRNRGMNTGVSPAEFDGFDVGGASGTSAFNSYRIDTPPVCSGSGPTLMSGDFDGDGDPDIIYATIVDENREGLLNHAYYYENLGPSAGLPSFAARRDIVAEFTSGAYQPSWHWTSRPFAVIDWDADGLDDILLGESRGPASRLLLFRSEGGGNFGNATALLSDTGLTGPFADFSATASGGCGGVSRGLTGLAAADFDDDGDNDIILGSMSESHLRHWRNDGSDSFTRMPDVAFAESGITFLLAADLDGDGDGDLAVGRDGWNCGGTGGTVWFLRNDGDATFTRYGTPIISQGQDLDMGVAFDIDNDPAGAVDLIAADGNNAGQYAQMLSEQLSIYNLTGKARSTVIDSLTNASFAIVGATVRVSASLPSGTGYDLYLSNNAGNDWLLVPEAARNGSEAVTFSTFGSDLLWRAELWSDESELPNDELIFAPASLVTPTIYDISVDFDYVDRRQYSRSALALASGLRSAAGDDMDLLYSSSFYFPGFEGTLTAHDVTAYNAEATNGFDVVNDSAETTTAWEAGALLRTAGAGERTIYTVLDDNEDGAIDTRTNFSAGNASVLAANLGVSSADAVDLISFVRGGMDHPSQWKLYDAGHSTPLFVGAPREDETAREYALNDYATFKATQADREGRVYIASNAGMIHAFDAETGEEVWSYIPYNLLGRLKQQRQFDALGDPQYQHEYLVDGQQTVRDVYDPDSTKWRTLLLSGQALGQGGGDHNYFFALDITDPDSPIPLWEFTDPWDNSTEVCSGDTTIETCEQSCTSTCSSSCDVPDRVFTENALGEITIEAESATSSTLSGVHYWVEEGPGVCPDGGDGSVPSGSCMQAQPESSGTRCSSTASCGAQLLYEFNVTTPGNYSVYVRGFATNGSDDSVFVSVDETSRDRVNLNNSGDWEWDTGGDSYYLAAGDHLLTVYMREDGARIDQLFLSTGGPPGGSSQAAPQTCAEQCEENCTETCTSETLDDSDEWPECGVGDGERCCVGSEASVCHPVGSPCPAPTSALGETWSQPAIGRVLVAGLPRYIAFFGSGYNNLPGVSDYVGRSLYGLDLVTGQRIAQWDLNDIAFGGSNPSTIDNTVPGSPRLADLTEDPADPSFGLVDRVYIGDLEGRLWKIELTGDGALSGATVSSSDWRACVLFDAGDPETDGSRTWAPIITRPAVAFPDPSTSYPVIYFGTGGDDRVPASNASGTAIQQRFYAVRDDAPCVVGDPYTPRVSYGDLSSSEFEWVIGDGLATDFTTALDDADAEGVPSDRYWSDPVVLADTVVYFASLGGMIESVNPCDNIAGGSKFYGYAARSFYSESEGRTVPVGTSIFSSPYINVASKIRQAVVIRRDGESTSGTARNSDLATSVEGTDVFVQSFASDGGLESPDVLAIRSPEIGTPETKLRVLYWREVSL